MKGWCSFATFLMAFLSNSSFASELHTPCFTLIEQALSVFFNVNYV